MKKYEFVGETIVYQGVTVRRIKRISDGKLGGWLESEENLSHDGNCWVGDNAVAYMSARVSGNARVYGNACVGENAFVYDNACVGNNAYVGGNSHVCGNARVLGWALVTNNAMVSGHSIIQDSAIIYDYAKVIDNASVCDRARVYGTAILNGDVSIRDSMRICGGKWNHRPLCIIGAYSLMNQSSPTEIAVNDTVKTLDEWRKDGRNILYGWNTEEAIEEVMLHIGFFEMAMQKSS